MKILGWCYVCRRMKQVNVKVMKGQQAVGICDSCAEKGAR